MEAEGSHASRIPALLAFAALVLDAFLLSSHSLAIRIARVATHHSVPPLTVVLIDSTAAAGFDRMTHTIQYRKIQKPPFLLAARKSMISLRLSFVTILSRHRQARACTNSCNSLGRSSLCLCVHVYYNTTEVDFLARNLKIIFQDNGYS